jgi:hypothetical protein
MAKRDQELAELEAAVAASDAGTLSEEIARRWDPERLLRLISHRAGSGRSLDLTTRQRYERKLGVDLSGVRVYTGEFAQRVTKAHRAEAITVGSTGIILMSGTPDRSPLTAAGRGLLAHELTHVKQAQAGLHYSGDDHAAPTSEKGEQEAKAFEAHEMGQSASPGGPAGQPLDLEAVKEELFARVLELLEEDERVWHDRNGDYPSRP